ncbi:MAG: DnaJ C-terminal domain-containing protein, partial [Pseudorhodoplanes sp.]
MRDPYEVLGVPRGASASAIKSAFRKLAKKLHPDANVKDPKAAGRFSELNSAYEILGDEKKRKAFDNGEIDAEGKPRFAGFEGADAGGFGQGGPGAQYETFSWGPGGATRGRSRGFSGFGGIDDILKDMMGGLGGARARGRASPFQSEDEQPATGQDIRASLTVNLSDLTGNVVKRVRLPTGKEVEVKIPAGIGDGQAFRLKGQGFQGPDGTGDVLITVTVARHPLFERDGNDLRLDLPVTLYEAVLGAKVRVPTLDGAVELAIPANTNGGRTFRLKGKGIPGKDGVGDLYATVRLVLPHDPDPDLEELMRRLRDQKPYDPRR